MASHAKHGWSTLQSAFTALKFSTTTGDTLRKDVYVVKDKIYLRLY
jgi:hypothetical protein